MKSIRTRLAGCLLLGMAWHSVGTANPAVPVAAETADMPPLCFQKGADHRVCIADWRGRVVLLNLWATWCAPCKQEMPQLNRLQAMLGGEKFEIVALSVDRGGANVVSNFYARNGVKNLAVYVDASVQAIDTIRARRIPISLLIDRQGQVVQRLSGPVDWTAAGNVESIRRLIAD